MKKRNSRENFFFLSNFQSFTYQKKETTLSHYYIIFDFPIYLILGILLYKIIFKQLQKLIFLLSSIMKTSVKFNKNNMVL